MPYVRRKERRDRVLWLCPAAGLMSEQVSSITWSVLSVARLVLAPASRTFPDPILKPNMQ